MERRHFLGQFGLASALAGGSLLGLPGCGPIEAVRPPKGGYAEAERQLLGVTLSSRRAAVVRHHLGPALRPWAANARLTLARGAEADRNDIELNYDAILDMWLQQLFAPPPAGVMIFAADPEVRMLGSNATVRCTVRVSAPRFGFTQRENYSLWLSESGWLIVSARWMPIDETENGSTVAFNGYEWRRRDARVKEAREMGDQTALVDALREAHRWPEAHDELERMTKNAEATMAKPEAAKLWALRGRVAVEAGRARDALPSFRTALRLDPKVGLPNYKAAADARLG